MNKCHFAPMHSAVRLTTLPLRKSRRSREVEQPVPNASPAAPRWLTLSAGVVRREWIKREVVADDLTEGGSMAKISERLVRKKDLPQFEPVMDVIAQNPDFCDLARAYGANAARPNTLADMQKAITDAFAADGPTLVHVTPEVLS